MIKIFFICPWESSELLLDKLKRNTPKNKGIWKNLIGVNNINESDYVVILDNLNDKFLNIGFDAFVSKIGDLNKIIYFQRENTAILNMVNKSWFQERIVPNLEHNYSYEDDFFYTFTTPHFLNKTYDELKSIDYPKKTNNISCIVSARSGGATYEDRKRFIIDYSNKYPNSIDIYGKGWKNQLGTNFKGELGSYHQTSNKKTSKLDGLLPYNYSICLENYPEEKVTSEKITDCILCWSMPIYSGTKVTNKYYPNDSFHLIDIKNVNVYEKVNEISRKQITEKNISALREARNLILDRYNIWEQVYKISDNYIKYCIYYNHNLLKLPKYLQHNLVCVNNKYKFVYIAPSRTGSTTIRKFYQLNDNVRRPEDDNMLNMREPYDEERFKDYLKIISIRQPVSRYKSMCRYIPNKGKQTIEEILEEIEFWPMSLYLKNSARFVSNLDFIIRFENIENDIKEFNKIIKYDGPDKIPHYNNTKSCEDVLNEEKIRLVKNLYEEDYLNFNYEL